MIYSGPFLCVRVMSLLLMLPTLVVSQSTFWQPTSIPPGGIPLALGINSKGHILAALGSSSPVYRSTDNGNSWTQVNAPNIGYISSNFAVTPEDNFLIGGWAGVFLTTDEGNTWSNRKAPTDYSGNSYSVTSFAVTPDSIIYAGTSGYGIYFSDNLGYSWYGNIDVGGNGLITSLACKTKGHVFAGTYNGLVESNTNGSAWAWLGYFGYINAIVITSPSYIFLATGDRGVYRSTDGGSTFAPVNVGLTRLNTKVMVADAEGHLFVGTDSAGVYRSMDNGNTWAQVNGGLVNMKIYSLALSPNGYLFVGTADGAIYRSNRPTTSVERIGLELPGEFSLEQNYPNPFNPTTTISFSLPHSEVTTLKIFDLMGKEISTLVARDLTGGRYSFKWDANKQPSGVYFYRLQAGQYTETRKLVLLR